MVRFFMADWDNAPPVFQLLVKLSALRLQAEKEKLLKRVAVIEAMAKAAGVSTDALNKIHEALNQKVGPNG